MALAVPLAAAEGGSSDRAGREGAGLGSLNDALLPRRTARDAGAGEPFGSTPERGRKTSDPDRLGIAHGMPPVDEPSPPEVFPSVGVGGNESKYDELVLSAHWFKLTLGDPGPRELARDWERANGTYSVVGEPPGARDTDEPKNVAGDGGTEKPKSHDGAPLIIDDDVDMRRTSWR